MAEMTAAQMVVLYNEAIQKVLAGQSYSMGGRTLTRANLKELQDGLATWERKATRAANGGIKVRRAVSRF